MEITWGLHPRSFAKAWAKYGFCRNRKKQSATWGNDDVLITKLEDCKATKIMATVQEEYHICLSLDTGCHGQTLHSSFISWVFWFYFLLLKSSKSLPSSPLADRGPWNASRKFSLPLYQTNSWRSVSEWPDRHQSELSPGLRKLASSPEVSEGTGLPTFIRHRVVKGFLPQLLGKPHSLPWSQTRAHFFFSFSGFSCPSDCPRRSRSRHFHT